MVLLKKSNQLKKDTYKWEKIKIFEILNLKKFKIKN